jgi:hypothetical protein
MWAKIFISVAKDRPFLTFIDSIELNDDLSYPNYFKILKMSKKSVESQSSNGLRQRSQKKSSQTAKEPND